MDTSHYLQHMGSSQRLPEAPITLNSGDLVRFSRYFDPYAGDYASSDIQGGMVGTLKGIDSTRADHYNVQLGDHTPVSVHKQNISLVNKN